MVEIKKLRTQFNGRRLWPLHVSPKRCKIGGKLVLIVNRKSYISFQLVPKSVTLNDLEQRNNPYFALFHRICVRCRCKTIVSFTSVAQFTFDSL